ncbi:hypothetical protein [Allosphingosinicella vermicomposti]|uniref:hypothetical protein n=1 Tax=Allosphingosinicella vermicomposti TaxID=614671 RepID=UPI000D10E4CB|nr:hypothetical protein [Allosphingosinicella vermicomposti]
MNDLYSRQQVELMRAAEAETLEVREEHQELADGYGREIKRQRDLFVPYTMRREAAPQAK